MSQDEYLAILFNDVGYSGEQRRAWLRAEYGVAYTDSLTVNQKRFLIDRLKQMKANQREAIDRERMDNEDTD